MTAAAEPPAGAPGQLPPRDSTGSPRAIARSTGVLVAGDVASKLASAAFFVVMARELGKRGFGDFTFALSLGLMLSALVDLGLDKVLVRDVARDRGAVDRLFWNALALKALAGPVVLGIALIVAVAGGYRHEVKLAVLLLALATVVEIALKTPYATFQARVVMRPIAVGGALERFATAAVGIPALLLGAGVVPAAAIYLGGTFVAAAYVAVAMTRHSIRPALSISGTRARRLLVEALPLGVTGIFATVLFRVDATMLSLYKGNAAVGLYGSAYQLLEASLFLSFSFVGATIPALARLGRNTRPTIGEAFEGACKVVLSMLLPIGVGFLLFAPTLTRTIFGHQYAAASSAVRLLGGAAALYGVSYLATYVLIGQDRQRLIPWITAAVMLQNIVLNLFLIPRWSFNGAAAATSISEATQAAVTVAFAIRATGAISLRRIASGPVLACAGMAAVTVLAGNGWPGIACAGAAYLLVLYAVERRLFPADVRTLADAVRRRRVVS